MNLQEQAAGKTITDDDRRALYAQLCARIADLNKREETLWTTYLSFFGGGLIIGALKDGGDKLTDNPLVGLFGLSVSLAFAFASLRAIIKTSSLIDKAELVEDAMRVPTEQGLYLNHPPVFILSFLVWCILYPVPFAFSLSVLLQDVPSKDTIVEWLKIAPAALVLIFMVGLSIRHSYRGHSKLRRYQRVEERADAKLAKLLQEK